ncbi:hypothetical protein M747DRAFT_246853 [Aspergillus niger ATCC 13496]|uniref:Uncharacterized protein n=3 Tax=Aspergillus niger TaxID=5061 RepID=A2R7H6_ASPNC|nr:hypothetical protein An16g03560 [Aspergillus niger]RDH15618.1 hypothetical protein M747DRAFT_246853 [Aspergillus niger ATCC 13496]CAK42854.1 hypothetical protein An16g03560 [Aspergillus niger]
MASSHSAVNPEVTGPSLSDFPESIRNKIVLVNIPAVEVQALIEKECPPMLQRIAPYGVNWMRHVMYNTIPKEIRVYAYLHYDMAQPDWYKKYGPATLLSRYNTHRIELEQEVSEEQARSMLRFYALVQYYAKELTEDTIRRQQGKNPEYVLRNTSRTEMLRVERAIYIHDILLQAMTTIPRHTMTRKEANAPWRSFLGNFTGWMLYQLITVTNLLHKYDEARCKADHVELQCALNTFSKENDRNYLKAAGNSILSYTWAKLENSDPEFNKQKFSPNTDPAIKRMYDPFVFIEEDNGPHRLWYEIAEERPANPDTMMGQFYSGSGHPQYMLFMWDEARLREMGYLSGDDSP